MEIEKPENFTRHKDKFVIWQKGYENHKRRRLWAKLEYKISLFTKRKELEDLCAINRKMMYKKSGRSKRAHFFCLVSKGEQIVKKVRREKKRKKKERPRRKVWISMIFGIDFKWKARILWFCMDF